MSSLNLLGRPLTRRRASWAGSFEVARFGARSFCCNLSHVTNHLHATIEEFVADGFTHIECYCPLCRMTQRPIRWLPRMWLNLTIAQLSKRLRCAECGGPVHSVKPWRRGLGKPSGRRG